jgi:hypothetical protein
MTVMAAMAVGATAKAARAVVKRWWRHGRRAHRTGAECL